MAMPPVAYDGMPVAADAVTITRAVERPAIRNWFGKTARCTRSSVTAVSRRTAGVLRVFATSRSTWAVQVLAGRCAGNASVAVEGRIPARPAAERFGLPVPSARRPPAPRAVVKSAAASAAARRVGRRLCRIAAAAATRAAAIEVPLSNCATPPRAETSAVPSATRSGFGASV